MQRMEGYSPSESHDREKPPLSAAGALERDKEKDDSFMEQLELGSVDTMGNGNGQHPPTQHHLQSHLMQPDAESVAAKSTKTLKSDGHAPESPDSQHSSGGRRARGNGAPRSRRAPTQSKPLGLARQYHNHVQQSWIEIKQNKCQFCLGCCSIFLVVFVVAIAMSTLSYSSILFLGLAETQSGEIDLMLTPLSFKPLNAYLNYTRMSAEVAAQHGPDIVFHQPRMVIPDIAINSAKKCANWSRSNPNNQRWPYIPNPNPQGADCSGRIGNCVNYNCDTGALGVLYLIDTEKERASDLGRSWPFDPVPMGGCCIQTALASYIQVDVGDYIVVAFEWTDSFATYARKASRAARHQYSDDEKIVFIVLKVEGIFTGSQGKWSQTVTNAIVVEYSTILPLLANAIHPSLSPTLRSSLNHSDPFEAVGQILFNFPPPRFETYSSSSFNTNARLVVAWASKIVYLLGFNQVNNKVPLLDALGKNSFASSFLNLILNIIILVLSGISILLIYSLLMISVESRTFELGVLRMIGLKRSGLVQMLIVHAMMFAIPAWVIGLVLAQLGFFGVTKVLYTLTNASISPLLSAGSILTSTALGLAIPLVSSILPIRNALTKNLHDSLDTVRSKAKAVMITVERASVHENLAPVVIIGAVLTIFGFCIYYLLPLALIRSNAALLFNIFLAIMIGMMVGLVLLALNLQPLLESFLIWAIFSIVLFFENHAVPPILRKNLMSHRLRNRKTAIAYAASLSFIIFLAVALQMELKNLVYIEYNSQGSAMRISVWDFNLDGTPLGISPITGLEEWANQHPLIVDYAWVSYNMRDMSNKRGFIGYENLGQFIQDSTVIYGVSPNFYDVVEPGFFTPTLWDQDSPFHIAEQLYTPKGFRGMIMGDYYLSRLDLTNLTSRFAVEIDTNTFPRPTQKRYEFEPIGFVRASSVFDLTYFPDKGQDSLVSFPTLLNLTDGQYSSVHDIPMRYLLFKLKDGATDDELDAFVRSVPPLDHGRIEDIRDQFSGLVKQQDTVSLIFQLVTVFTMLVSFFSLNTSMYTNIMEQSKEVGILRALGLGKYAVYRIYTYESFILVFSSAILGGLIGTLIGWSISAQRALFTQIPLSFEFPWDLVFTVTAVSFVCAVLSTFFPVYRLVKLRVVNIMRLN